MTPPAGGLPATALLPRPEPPRRSLSLSAKISLAFLTAILLFVVATVVQIRAMRAQRTEAALLRETFALQEAAVRFERDLGTLADLLARGHGMDLAWTRARLERLAVHDRAAQLGSQLGRMLRSDAFPRSLVGALDATRQRVTAIAEGDRLLRRIARDPAARAALAPVQADQLMTDARIYPMLARLLLTAWEQQDRARVAVLSTLVRHHLHDVARATADLRMRFGTLKHRLEVTLSENSQRALQLTLGLHVAALAVAILLLAAVILSLRPIQALIAGVRRMGQGELDAPVPVRRGDEIGQLAAEIAQMAQALKRQRQALVQAERLAAIGKMAAHVAHEVRNPLNAIALNVEMIEDDLGGAGPQGADDRVGAMLAAIKGELERLTAVTDAYLGYARLPHPRKEPIDLASLAQAVVSFQGEAARVAGVSLHLDAPAPVEVSADPDQLRQALLNLLVNAIEAAGDGGHVTVSVTTADLDGRPAARVVVSDDGPGVPSEVAEEIFEPFVSRKKHGTGLGLSVSRRVAEHHGGQLTLEAPPAGRTGACFVLTVPMGDPAGQQAVGPVIWGS